MLLNKFGQIAYNEWLKTPEIRNNLALGEFVVMPNHIHCIIQILGRGEYNSPLRGPSNNIGAIVRGYKSTVTKQLNILNIGCPVWQRNYYEHIIRDELSYQQISNYITNNPEKWANDTYNIK
jgi:REP element-mobilizing transposase RayT